MGTNKKMRKTQTLWSLKFHNKEKSNIQIITMQLRQSQSREIAVINVGVLDRKTLIYIGCGNKEIKLFLLWAVLLKIYCQNPLSGRTNKD